MIQGINKEYIFSEERYIYQYLKFFKRFSKECNIKTIAYCMMNNHAHFLLKVNDIKDLSKLMQRTNSAYAKYYNFMNSNRVGYVFRNRFLSEPITDHRYFIQCIKYIHLNPVKANIVKNCGDYKFSSYNYYVRKQTKINKEEYFSEEDYKEICNSSSCTRNFLDIDRNINEDIEFGIRNFLNKEETNLFCVYSNRKMLIKLIEYLKREENIKYIDIGKYLEIPTSTMQGLREKTNTTPYVNDTLRGSI